jgi:BirA family biotin operon repressor/biotin-[acetyl-CoA-carboxylase] ligase
MNDINGYNFIHLDQVGSTNDEARRYLSEGAAHDRYVITAIEQLAGRGRANRTWISNPGNLFATLILIPDYNQADWPQLTFLISLAIAEAIELLLPVNNRVQLKWPNDVLVNDQKISGILLEKAETTDNKQAMLIGFGINCRYHPDTPLYPAIDLLTLGAKPENITPDAVLTLILQKFEPLYQNWISFGFKYIRSAWLARAKNLGELVSIRVSDYLEQQRISGLFLDIDEETGALLLQDNDGAVRRVLHGDVFFEKRPITTD